ncbi:hypothetical protein FQ192_17255 [Pseudomonas sp. ANT_J12]|nr:hypothetical protein FQ192_17255 [Pseudomonas sp. ANT_J12]
MVGGEGGHVVTSENGWVVIVPTLRVGMPLVTLCVTLWDAERPGLHSHAERGNDQDAGLVGKRHPMLLFGGLHRLQHRQQAIITIAFQR